jgi:hypothetical protein
MSEMPHSQSSTAESMLQDAAVQDGLRVTFAELDNFYDGIRNQTPYERQAYPASVTPDGTFLEASRIALPLPPYDKDGYSNNQYNDRVQAQHDSAEYVLFKFELGDVADPQFKVKPAPIRQVQDRRGSGVDITIDNPDDPEPLFPDALTEEGANLSDEQFDEIDARRTAWRRRNVVHLPQMADDRVRLGDVVAESFKDVRERAGVAL